MTQLGPFEIHLLFVIKSFDSPIAVKDLKPELSKLLKRDVSDTQLYLALRKLVSKRLLETQTLAGEPRRGGRRKNLYCLTPLGVSKLNGIASLVNLSTAS